MFTKLYTSTSVCYFMTISITEFFRAWWSLLDFIGIGFTLTLIPVKCARNTNLNLYLLNARGGLVVKALRYKPTARGFDSLWCHWNFSVTLLTGRTMALGSTQPLTEMSTRFISWG